MQTLCDSYQLSKIDLTSYDLKDVKLETEKPVIIVSLENCPQQ